MVSYIPGGNFAKLYSCFFITASCWGGSDHRPSASLAACFLAYSVVSGLLIHVPFLLGDSQRPVSAAGKFRGLRRSVTSLQGRCLQGLPPPVCPRHHLASADAPALTATPAASGQRAGWSVGFLLQIVKKSAWEEVLADSRTSLKGEITTRLEKLNLSVQEETHYHM